jgi:hypothetical protein
MSAELPSAGDPVASAIDAAAAGAGKHARNRELESISRAATTAHPLRRPASMNGPHRGGKLPGGTGTTLVGHFANQRANHVGERLPDQLQQ